MTELLDPQSNAVWPGGVTTREWLLGAVTRFYYRYRNWDHLSSSALRATRPRDHRQ